MAEVPKVGDVCVWPDGVKWVLVDQSDKQNFWMTLDRTSSRFGDIAGAERITKRHSHVYKIITDLTDDEAVLAMQLLLTGKTDA
jgi:hypothetical protein